VPPGTSGSDATLAQVQKAVQSSDGVTFVFPPHLNPAGDTAVMQVFPKTSPQDAKTVQLIHHLRNDVLPAATSGTGMKAHVGGITAAFDDVSALLEARLPWFIGSVLLMSFLLLMVVFRSLLVPLKAVIMNLLSIGAAYGVLVAVFQKGELASVFNVGKGPIESFLPMMLFAILFGLSMDYEVFLLSRVKEEYDRTHDNGLAVADGLSATARVITAAALIMVTVFGSFVFTDERVIKEFGLGLAVAILVDATVVRMLLVPATMELLGDANWWLPKWLDRRLPNVHIEGEPDLDHEIEELLEAEGPTPAEEHAAT
jgi:RND superfamily putative drug exporter